MVVSIITVCYNSISTIQKTIDSVASQTYLNIEYIIIDGNSSDGTFEVIHNNMNSINKFVSEPDCGLYDAMNKGISIATGDLIGILNSDDVFSSNKVVEDIVAFHSSNFIMASVGNIIQVDKNGKVVRFYSSKNWNPFKLKIGFMPPHPSIFFKRELFERFGNFNLNFKIGADYEIITRFFLKNQISWKYSGITTTSMLLGGLSNSGFSSYNIITLEIQKALLINDIKFNPLAIYFRFLWKVGELLRK